MDIFKALRDGDTPETYLQSLLRKGAKREIPYIVNLHLSDEIQKSLHIDFSADGLSLDRPWKTVPKKVLLKHVQKYKDKSPFHPFADHLKMLRDSEVLIGLDTSNLKNLSNYYICVTQDGKTAVLEELKALHKRIMDYINNSFTKEPGTWVPLGSEEEMKANIAVNNRPLISYEWVGNKIDRMNRLKPLNFSNLDADSNAHTHCSIVDRGRSKYKLVEAVAVHTDVQVAPKMIDAPAQTIPEIPMNASTQFNPEIDAQEKEERIQNQAPLDENVLAGHLKKQYGKIMSALEYNGEYDLYKDDYEYLVKEGKKSGVVTSQTYVHFLTLVNTMCDPNKYITCTAWHPGLCGTVAVAYGDNVIFRNEEIQSDSDDSDYEVKPSKPEEHVPKIDPLLLASEVVEAALWKSFCHEMLEHFDSKEDTTNYKLGILTITYLERSQQVRDREIYLEKKYEESRPELEAMEFDREFAYEDYEYDESTYNPDEDLIYKFRLDEYSSVPPDSDAPQQNSIVNFDELVKPYLEKDTTPIIQEPKTLNIVWDTNNWNLGYSLKEEATIVHRRHFMQALVDIGPLLEIPRPKTYCPFLRVKRTGYRVHKSGKAKKIRKSLSSRGSIQRHPVRRASSKRGSNASKASDSISVSSYSSRQSRISDRKKKQRTKYIEVSDDEEMERQAKEFEIVETGPTHNIYIWSIHNDLEPLLKLVSPYEVSAMNFSPHNGDLLAAGTISGQIVLWDLQGKLLQRDESEPSNFERYARKELKRRMSWYRELRVPGRLRETAVSTMSGAHNSKVISIHWIHPQLVQGHFNHIEAEGDLANSYSLQFLSTSLDGDIKCWDLRNEPLPKTDYMFAERTIARKMKNPKPELLVALTSKYTEYHNRWIPTYTLKEPFTENAKGVKSQCSLLASSVQFHTKLYPYKRKYPPDPRFKDKMTDLVEYQYNPQPRDLITYSQTAFIGTMFGVVALLSWNGQPPNPKLNEPVDRETLDINVMAAVHDGPIIGVLRHPFISDVALSVGGHVWAIWNFVEMTWPIKWKRYYGKQITCCSWSPLKPSLFRIGLTDGTVEIWDLILQSHEPKAVIPAAGVGITGFSSHNLPLPKGLMGACDMNASIVFYYIPWIYQSWRKHELEALKEMLAKEPERHKELNQWAANWRETHVRLNKKLNEPIGTSAVKVNLHEDDSGEEAKKKKKDDDEDSIFKIGRFEPRKNVPPRECKAYYRELYKWYLRRRGRTTRLMEEKERKWYEEEEKAIIKDLLKNKRIDLNQLQKTMIPLVQNENRLKAKEGRVIAMLAQADKIFKTAVAKIFNVVNYQVSYASKDSLIDHQDASKLDSSLKEIEFYFGQRYEEAEKDLQAKLGELQFNDRTFEELLQEKIKKRELFNDRRRFWDPEEKWMRILARNIIEENGFICGQWEPHELTYEYRKYAYRLKNIDEYKQLFGDDYDPLWDVGKHVTDVKEFPYNWPYVTEEDLAVDESAMYKSEHKFPIVNTNSALDLDFIANTDQNVVALMLFEQQQGSQGGGERPMSALIDLDDKMPQTRVVPVSNSQLSLFKTEVDHEVADGVEVDDAGKRDADASSVDMDDNSQATVMRKVDVSARNLEVSEVIGSELIVSESSQNIGIKRRSRVELEDSESRMGQEKTASDVIEGKSDDGEGEDLTLAGTAGSTQLSQQLMRSDVQKSEESGSEQILFPGDPLYPDNWRDICEDECLSEGESIPSPRSSPSNVTDFSDITEVELFVPSDAEEEPYQEYFDETVTTPFGPPPDRAPSRGEDEEPTEEYVGESEDDGEASPKKRGPSFLRGRPVATSSSGSSDEDTEKRQDLERTFSQIIADRKKAMAEREQKLRELD